MCRSPRARAGLSMLLAFIAPSPAPAPTTVCSSSMKTMSSSLCAVISSMTFFSRSSKSPRYRVPATRPARSSRTRRLSRSVSGTSPSTMRCAMPSAIAVLPTPGSPMSTGLFFVRRDSTSIVCSISACAADHRVDPVIAGHGGEIGAVLVDGGGVGRRPPGRARPRAAAGGRLLQRLRGDPRVPQLPSGGRFGVDGQREQQVLGPDVGRAERPGDLPRVEQRPLGRRGQAGRLLAGLAAPGAGFDVPGDGVRIGARRGEQPADRLLTRRRPEQVVGVQVGVAPPGRLGGGVPHQLARLLGQQLTDVDSLGRPLRHRAAEEARENVIERAGA